MGRQDAKSLLLLLVTNLITITWSAIGANSLTCYCNVCPNTDSCETAISNESICFKSVERYFIKENGTYIMEASYGCISGGDGLLAPLQCHANSLKHTEPRFISCCKDRDYCNEFIPDPTEEDDPRWKMNEPQGPEDSFFKVDRWQMILLIAVVALLIGCIMLKIMIVKTFGSKSSNASRASTYFLDADLEKFSHHQHVTGSSLSTHSYSLSDDMCHKPEPSNAAEDSYIPTDLTSGVGERMLNQRTMARAVGSGKTEHVGSGRFGRVFRGEFHGEDVAVKAFQPIDQESWLREDHIFRNLNHENIVRFITSQVYPVDNTTTEIWMFLEYCPLGSLCDYLDHYEILGPQQAVKILYSIINGLNYLHEDYAQASRVYKPSIAHRDIKSKNILMKTPETCCIADFGHALVKLDEETLDYGKYQHLQVGTIRYMAPEILRTNDSLNYRHFSTFAQADLYQYGLILWEVCHRTALDILHPSGDHKLPYDGVVPQNPDIQDMVKIVCEDQYRPPRYDKWDKYPMMKRLAELMVECWRPNPKARMETLGVKKKLRELYDQVVIPLDRQQYQNNIFNNFSLSPHSRNDSNKTRSSDVTL